MRPSTSRRRGRDSGSRAPSESRSTSRSRHSSAWLYAARHRQRTDDRAESLASGRSGKGGRMSRKLWVWIAVLAVAGTVVTAAGASTRVDGSQKLTKVTLQLKWVTQAQFAGYYAAKAKGYYTKAG